MAEPLENIEKKIDPKILAAAEKKTNEMLAEMSLQELRRAHHFSGGTDKI